jgi:PAS domain S-box-containing protein
MDFKQFTSVLSLIEPEDFMPHGQCLLWAQNLLALHVGSDIGITLAYLSIAVALTQLTLKRRDLIFRRDFALFGLFIFLCGTTHLVSVITIWNPLYWMEGWIKLGTSIVSIFTAILLWPLLPKAIALPSPQLLKNVNEKLKKEIEERIRSEEALRDTRNSLEAVVKERTKELENSLIRNNLILNSAGEGIIGINNQGVATFLNPAGANMLGYQVNEIIGKPLLQFLQPNNSDDTPLIQENDNIATIIKEKKTFHKDDAIFWKKDGSKFHAEYFSNPIQENEDIVGTVLTFKDITNRLTQEQELKENEARIKAVLENVVDGIINIDEEGTVERFNPAAESIFGYTADEVIGKNIKMLMPEPFHAEHDQYLENYLKTGKAQIIGLGREVIGLKKNGDQFPCDLGISEVWVEDQRLFTGIIRDVSERKQSEQKVKDSENRVKAVLENVVDGIINIDEEGTVERFNPAAESIFGYTLEEVIGNNIKMLMPEPYHAEHDQYLENYLKTGKAQIIGLGREVIGLKKNGDQFPCDLGISEVWVEDQRLFTGIIRDVSERKHSEKQLEEARLEAVSANHAKSIFLANMSHEIRTPMNAILGYSQILLRKKDLSPGQKEGLETISRSGNNLLELINDILDISKIEAGQMTLNPIDFDMASLITGIHSLFQASCQDKFLSLETNNFDRPIFVHGDEVKIRQILINLVGNAIKFTERGKILLKVEQKKDHLFRFGIKDTGLGIPAKNHESIFEPFRQNEEGFKKGGTGLGLAISQKQAKLMGGEIALESVVGKGSTFTFELPLSPAKKEVTERSKRENKVIRLKEIYTVKALVVDDVKENRDVLKKLLEDVDIKVIEAENGKIGIKKFKEEKPDIIFMDIRMPVMDGLEAIRKLKQNYSDKELNIVVVSASVLKHEQERYEALGCQEILLKPFRAEQVFASVQKMLGVEFEYEEDITEDQPEIEIDFSKVKFPQSIISDIREASKVCNLTLLAQCLKLMEPNNQDETAFINKLGNYKSIYNMEAIIELLEKLDDAS